MATYVGIVHKDPGSAFGISFPDAPGCFSASDDFDGLIRNAREALALWHECADDHEVSAPRGLAAIAADPACAEALANAVHLVSVEP